MTLENLVPSLEDCQRIPQGSFTDSAIVRWRFSAEGEKPEVWLLMPRGDRKEVMPAPTLAEILAELPNGVHVFRDIVAYPLYGLKYENENLATAALRLWMKVNGREVK